MTASVPLQEITRRLNDACDFVTLPKHIEDIMKKHIDRGFIGDRKYAYKIQPEDDGIIIFDRLINGIRDAVKHSKRGILAGYNYMTIHVIPTVNDELNHTEFQPIYITFTEKNVVLISQNNVSLKLSTVAITRQFLHSTLDADIEYMESYSKIVTIFIDILSKLNHIRRRQILIQHRLCFRKSVGLGR